MPKISKTNPKGEKALINKPKSQANQLKKNNALGV